MAATLPRGFGLSCRSCNLRLSTFPSRSISSISLLAPPLQKRGKTSRIDSKISRRTQAHAANRSSPVTSSTTRRSRIPAASNVRKVPIDASNPMQTLSSIRQDVSKIITGHVVPEQLELLELLNRILEFSNILAFGQPEAPTEDASAQKQGTSAILDDLEEPDVSKQNVSVEHAQGAQGMSNTFRMTAADAMGELFYNLVRDPKVTITPEVLQVYTRVQCILDHGEYLPEIFELYAHKPVPVPNTSPIRYRNPWPNSPRNAIPQDLSDAALEWAIVNKNLSVAIAVIDTTVATKAFRRAKLIRKATLPGLAVGSLPLVVYACASWLSTYQNTMDDNLAKWSVMAAGMAYVGTMTTVGFVAVTTWNDQMERVRWRVGTPMWMRWKREEERAYYDRLAQAWGFSERWRRGEEQGEDWDALRELTALGNMELDKPELMDGME